MAWVWKRYSRKPRGTEQVRPGQILFFGDPDSPQMIGIVESVGDGGTATFIGVRQNKVQRMRITMSRPQARRDEATLKTLNSHVRKGMVAGEGLMGLVQVIADAKGPGARLTAAQ